MSRTSLDLTSPALAGLELKENEPLSKHTYYQIGGPARLLTTPRSSTELKVISEILVPQLGSPFLLGLGTNLLVADHGYSGLVLKTTRLNLDIEQLSNTQVRVGASVPISMLLRKAGSAGWGGLECWTGIPGTVGGAIFMNAGTHLGETKDLAASLRFFDLKKGEASEVQNLRFSYRTNHFLEPHQLVTEVVLNFKPTDPKSLQQRFQETLDRRKKSQPIESPSCGSVFKNPLETGLHSWQVIERLGLRGHQIGQAQFSVKHCNFIVNLGGAKASDVRALIELAKSRAHSELGIELHEEVRYLGF